MKCSKSLSGLFVGEKGVVERSECGGAVPRILNSAAEIMRLYGMKSIELARRCFLALIFSFLLFPFAGFAQEKTEVSAMQQDGFGRVILTFSNRLDLPNYELTSENGVLAIEFDSPLDVMLPDINGAIPDFISISRVDPDKMGIRFGLKGEVRVNRLEAGEQLYLDFLPMDWQGLAPGLPAEVVAELSKRAQDAAEIAELEQRIEFARVNNPTAEISVGRHPTFMRILFDWSEDTTAIFSQEGDVIRLEFDWPVDLDFYQLVSDMPPEIVEVKSSRLRASNLVEFYLEEGVTPRFFENSKRQFVLDIDLINPVLETLSAEDLLLAAQIEQAEREAELQQNAAQVEALQEGPAAVPVTDQIELTPEITKIGSTIRIAFPFVKETPAAVFERGDYLWLVLDSTTIINAPDDQGLLSSISDDFATISAGDTQIVRMKMTSRRLVSLGSQGPSWVLSLGDALMAPTEPIRLDRRQDEQGRFEIVADVERPVRVHELRDPEIGDILEVVTVYPPAHGIVRRLRFVDFDALSSIHGLVIAPAYEGLNITLGAREIVLGSEDGLIVSSLNDIRDVNTNELLAQREGFVDLEGLVLENPIDLLRRREELLAHTADSVGREKENSRMNLAYVLLANQLGLEAIGVLDLLIQENKVEELLPEAIAAKAAASVLAYRPSDALEMFKYGKLSQSIDNLMWRAIARVQARDYVGARIDVLASEIIASSYPVWLQNKFFLAGIEAAIETRDKEMALRLMREVHGEKFTSAEKSQFGLFEARLDEFSLRYDEALDTYGAVISQDVRPTRAEAIYRTILLLQKMGRLDEQKAIQTLSRESIVWRGGVIEAKMLELLAELQFESKHYRDGFSTVREASETKMDDSAILDLANRAQREFADLFINGAADSLGNVEALSLYYDFRYLTPSGARGDEMIRNLARRLIRVDLLSQAAELLEYQVDVRLEGAARSQIAADLAVIYIADRKPALALKALNVSALANLPPSLERQRRLLEGRALIDEGRMNLALDVMANLEGRDVDLLRIDAYWQGENYLKAAEQIELIYSRGDNNAALSLPARMNVIKAAVGYVLGGDELGLARMRSRFSERLANSPEWPMFDYVTGTVVQTSVDFRSVASKIAAIDGLSAFLNSYRLTYGADGSLAPKAGVERS